MEQRKIPQPTFYVKVTLWLQLDMHIWVPFFFLDTEGVKESKPRAVWNLVQEQGCLDLTSD